MGYYMAVNLRNKIGKDKGMVVCDVNSEACERFLTETADAGSSSIVKTAREAVEAAVRHPSSDKRDGKPLTDCTFMPPRSPVLTLKSRTL